MVVNPDNLHRPAQPEPATEAQHADPEWLPDAQYWVPKESVSDNVLQIGWTIGFKEITAPTHMRTVIATALPGAGFGNKVPIWASKEGDRLEYGDVAPLLLANLNTFALDFVARQKLHGQTPNLFILEQLPLVPPKCFDDQIAGQSIGDFVREQVLHLTCTAVDMALFARDIGYEGKPFVWDEDERRHRMARLDALFFHLYGLDRDDADYVLGTFRIVRREDEKTHDRYLTRDLIIAYMSAVEAGDLQTRVSV